jgi:hypothetical protein
MQNFSISFFINNINASQETKHHQQQSKSVDEKKKPELEKTQNYTTRTWTLNIKMQNI